MKKIIFILFIFLFPFFNSYSQELNITNEMIKESNPHYHYDIDVTYPEVDFGPEALMGLRGIASDINNSIDTMITSRINSFRDDAMDFGYDTNIKANSSLEITYETLNSSSSLLSFNFNIFYYFSGAAHPMTEVSSFNYGINSGGILELPDLFAANSNYIEFLSRFSINELKQKLKEAGIDDSGWIEQGAGPKPENFSVWNIKEDTLLITFNAYRVGPYAIGIQEVVVPLRDIKDMLDPDGPLGYYCRMN
jgi:hypothetical protein